VNAIIETEKSVKTDSNRSTADHRKISTVNSRKQSGTDNPKAASGQQRTVLDSAAVKTVNSRKQSTDAEPTVDRAIDFKAILSRFNSIGQTGQTGSSSGKDVPSFPRQRNKFYLRKEETRAGGESRC
jgi:hypothetical protein